MSQLISNLSDHLTPEESDTIDEMIRNGKLIIGTGCGNDISTNPIDHFFRPEIDEIQRTEQIMPRIRRLHYPLEIQMDLLNVHDGLIIHQINCISTKALGLAYKIFTNYPESNVYDPRIKINPGEIIVRNNNPIIIAFAGQYYPGKCSKSETAQVREKWFLECLVALNKYLKENCLTKDIYFPYGIGCGLAGGKWDNYSKMINDFSNNCENSIIICKHT